uniref:Uncharacterized protein n=1 Tax=Parascaris univalens TaxID=6257 RepID=A0A915BDX0_PARUN
MLNIVVVTQHGIIVGVKIRFDSAKNNEVECFQTSDVSFVEVTHLSRTARRRLSRFDMSERRLRCPSEVTCLKEFAYFLTLIDYHSSIAQFIILLPFLFIALISLSFYYFF